ncbi:MAG: hypothetical protein AAFW73_06405 [Bacteroidota bacterium]
MNRFYWCWSFCLLLGASTALAQDTSLSNLRIRRVVPSGPALLLDSLTIVPGSIQVLLLPQEEPLPADRYRVEGQRIYWQPPATPPAPTDESVEIRYRVFPFDLRRSYRHLDSSQIQASPDGSYADFNYTPYELGSELISFQGLQYDGSYTNGVSFGNSQSLVVNSNFNLRMSGTLGDDIEIVAAISDQNIPLQPEGNTQQLQEFDRIFIQLKRKESLLIAGDYELARPKSRFMNYFKKLQGASLSHRMDLGRGQLSSKASVAIARGKFARNFIVQQEGNQGPYRLRGNEGETFIIILAGTEKVYIDGLLLTRGLDADYTIDYNRGDVTFTNRRLITKDTRIIVEFEYNDQNYLRSLMAANAEYQTDKLRLHLNLYSEQDSKNSGAAADLDSLQRRALFDAGDRLERSVSSSLDSIEEYSAFRISYKLVDTSYTCGGDGERVLVYTTSADSAQYTASFLLLGQGQGNYVLDVNNTANGRVYRWVAPDPLTCTPRGAYEPLIRLIPPEQRQLFTLGADYQISSHSSISTEVALSNRDPNRFSSLDEADDQGVAAFASYRYDKQLGGETGKWGLLAQVDYEFVQRDFSALNPYRPAEFARDWNLTANPNTTDSIRRQQHFVASSIGLRREKWGRIAYELGSYSQESAYRGLRQGWQVDVEQLGFRLNTQGSWIGSEERGVSSRFWRPRGEFSKRFDRLGGWTVGWYGEQEKNQRRELRSDTLDATSFDYDLWRFFIRSQEGKKFSFSTSYGQRRDWAAAGADFAQSTDATDINVQGQWRAGQASRLQWNLNYRQLEIVDTTLSDFDPQETFLGRLEHNLRLWKGLFSSTTNYEIGGGQEPLIEYRYLEVPRGEGVFFWDPENADFNEDGVPQINEIQEAPFADQANIVRVTLFTDQFIRTNKTQLNQSLRLEPKSIWGRQQKGWKKWLSRWSTLSTFLINRRTREAEGVSSWNPFQINISDTALVALNLSIQNTLFFRPNTTRYNFQLSQKNQRSRQVLTTGFQSLRVAERSIKGRWNQSAVLSTDAEFLIGSRTNDFQLFNEQDYDIQLFRLAPSLTIRPNNSLRGIFRYRWEEGENRLPEGGETAVQHDFSFEFTYNQAASTAIRLNFSFVDVRYRGERNSPVELALLQGLKDGKNFLWELSVNRTISQNLTLRLSYNGRQTGGARIVHLGSMEVGARF